MSLWVTLPDPLDAAELLPNMQRQNVTYLPGTILFRFALSIRGTLRLSFGGLSPAEIETGLRALGSVITEELKRARAIADHLRECGPAMV